MFNRKNLIIHEIRNHLLKFLQFNNLLNLLYVITIYKLKLFINMYVN